MFDETDKTNFNDYVGLILFPAIFLFRINCVLDSGKINRKKWAISLSVNFPVASSQFF